MHTTTRLALPVIDSGDNVEDFPVNVDQPSKAILDNFSTFISGTLNALPSPGQYGRRYYATDRNQELFDTGSHWLPVSTPLPLGTITNYAGSADPVDPDGTTRWLVCDGRAISRTTYANLFAIIGTRFGIGNGTTTFNIADGRGRVIASFGTVGITGGEEAHTITGGEQPVHGHTGTDSGSTGSQSNSHEHTIGGGAWSYYTIAPGNLNQAVGESVGGTATFEANTGTQSALHTHSFSLAVSIASVGGGGSHDNMQPYLALSRIIKVL